MKKLIRQLGAGDKKIQSKAIEALIIQGESAVNTLVESLASESEAVRPLIVTILGRIGSTKALAPLIAALSDVNPDVRKKATLALWKVGGARAVEPLVNSLNDVDEGVRANAAWVLGAIGDRRAVEPLFECSEDLVVDVRCNTLWALGEIGDSRSVDLLIASLSDENLRVEKTARKALESICNPQIEEKVFNKLIQALQNNLGNGVTGAFGKIGKRAVKPLIALLEGQNNDLRYRVEGALVQIGTPSVDLLVDELINGNKQSKATAAGALGRIKDDRAIPALITAMSNPYWVVRYAAQGALENIGETAQSQIRNTLLDTDLDLALRGKLLTVLGRMDALQDGDLGDALRYGDSSTQIIAATRLGEIETQESYAALNLSLQRESHPDVYRQAKMAVEKFVERGTSLLLDYSWDTDLFATWRRADNWFTEVIKYFREVGFFQEYNDLSNNALIEAVKTKYDETHYSPLQGKLTHGLLLHILATDRNRVWWRDLEADVCRENKVYTRTIKEWREISCGLFLPEDIEESWKSEKGPIFINFNHKGKSILLEPKHMGDWIDLDILNDINELISDTNIRFKVFEPFDQSTFVVSLTAEQKRRLQKDLGWVFY